MPAAKKKAKKKKKAVPKKAPSRQVKGAKKKKLAKSKKEPAKKAKAAQKKPPKTPRAAQKATEKGVEAQAQNVAEYDSQGRAICREVGCDALAVMAGYCRAHYIKNWKKIKRKEMILREKKLNRYIEELVAKYPDKYIEAIREDLANDKAFSKVVTDLELGESVDDFDSDSENIDSLIDNIRRDLDEDSEF